MTKFKKGHKGYWTGKKRPPLSEKTKEKIRETLMNHPVSEETKKKITEKSIFQKGCIPWNKNIPHSEQTKEKIRQTNKRKRIEPKVKFVGFGVNHPKWMGGTYGTERHREMGRIEYRLWRDAVYARDNWTCLKCQERKKFLNAHHIQNFSEVKELRTSIENGITLCRDCHIEFHKTYGYKNNNKEQLEEFLEIVSDTIMENIKKESKNLETSPIYSWSVSLGGKSPYERRGDRTFDLIRNQYTDDPDYPKKIIWKPIIKKIKQK